MRTALRFAMVYLCLSSCPAFAADSWTKFLDAYVRAHEQNGDFSGTIRISRHGKVVFEKSYGQASQTFRVPNSKTTRVLTASVTKTMTAAGIVLLQQEGKLDLNDKLAKFFPDFPHADEITITHLLGHASGLDNPDYNSIAGRNVSAAS